MNINNVPKEFEGLIDNAYNTFKKSDPVGLDSMRFDTINLSVGGMDIDAGAAANPLFVGDSNIGSIHGMNPQMEALYKTNQVGMQYKPSKWDKTKWDIHFAQAKAKKMTGDAMYDFERSLTMDASGPLIAGSLLSPNSINWIAPLFKQPLSWSKVSDLVQVVPGDNAWAVSQAMAGVSASGWGAVNTAGGAGNTMSQDVEAKLDMLTQPIINIDVTYKLTIEELERSKSGGQNFPMAGQAIAYKQRYAKYVSDMIRDGLIVYGNAASGNIGLLGVNAITAWTSIGSNQSLATIAADGANAAKGNKIYSQFRDAAVSFLNPMKNRASKIHATMSVEAYNDFTSIPYSDIYNPTNVMQIFGQTFDAGGNPVTSGTIGGIPIDIRGDPMLSGSGKGNFFNAQTYDYLIFSADEVAGGPDEEKQSLIYYGQPLGDFVYPVQPQQFSTQYRYLKRVSGIFAPYGNAVKVYSGYGYAS